MKGRPKRHFVFQLRLSQRERENLFDGATSAGLSVSDYIRAELCSSAITRSVRLRRSDEITAQIKERTRALSQIMPHTEARRQAAREIRKYVG